MPGQDGPFVDMDDLRDSGNPHVRDDVDVPEIPEHAFVVDDDDAGECRWGTKDELRPMYIDNVDLIEGVQHDVWTLQVDDSEEFRFRTRSGSEAVVRWGDIDVNTGQSAERFVKRNSVVWPSDDYQTILLNATNTPRLAALKQWMNDELARRSEERLEIAELVNTFSGIIGMYSGPLGEM